MNKKLTQNFPRVVMSVNILLFIIIFWSIFVFSNYFRFFPLSFDLIPKISIEINRFIPILPIHLNNIFYSILIIFAGFGIGKIIFYTLFRKNLFIIKTFEERIFFSVSIGLGFLSLLVLLFGYLGLLKKSLFLMIIILLVIPTLSSLIKNYKYIKMPKTNFFEKIIIGIILYIMLINLFGALTPETFYDSQFYQLGIPAFWIQEGRIFVTKYLLQTFFPFNINMLYLLSILLNNEISAKMIHYFLGVIICFGIYVFSKKYFSKTVGLIAVLIFYSIPTVSMISWKTAIELGIGVFEFGCVFALINFMNSIDYKVSNISCADKSLFWLILSAILCGFSLGCKYTSIVFCFLPCLISIFFICISKKVKISLCLKYIFLFIIISFIIASPWFVRNMIVTKGNPFFPFFYEKFGNMKIKFNLSLFSDPPYPKFNFFNYFLFLWPLTMGKLQQESFPGVLFLTFFPILLVLRKIHLEIKLLFVYIISAILFWIILGRFYLRYFVPTLAVISVIYSYYISKVFLESKYKNFFYIFLIFITLFVNFMFSKKVLEFTHMPYDYIFGNISFKEYLSTQRPSYPCPYYQVINYINENLPHNAKIMFLGETRPLYTKRKFIFYGVSDYSPLIELINQTNSSEDLYQMLRKEKITHILLNLPEAKRLAGYDIFYFEPKDFKIWCEFWNKYVKEIYRDIADIALPDRGIYSLKKQAPDWWQQYASNPFNYVYLYEIIPKEEAEKPHQPPYNFFLHKEFYSQERWEKLKPTVEEIISSYR